DAQFFVLLQCVLHARDFFEDGRAEVLRLRGWRRFFGGRAQQRLLRDLLGEVADGHQTVCPGSAASASADSAGGGSTGAGSAGGASAATTGGSCRDSTDRALGGCSASVTSHSQQSLQRRHFSQRWLLHASLVQRTQIREDSSPQMLQVN